MTEDLSFSEQLSVLLAGETLLAINDPGRMKAMIDLMSLGLGLAIALAAEGDGATIEQLLSDAEARAFARAVLQAPRARETAMKIRGHLQ